MLATFFSSTKINLEIQKREAEKPALYCDMDKQCGQVIQSAWNFMPECLWHSRSAKREEETIESWCHAVVLRDSFEFLLKQIDRDHCDATRVLMQFKESSFQISDTYRIRSFIKQHKHPQKNSQKCSNVAKDWWQHKSAKRNFCEKRRNTQHNSIKKCFKSF